MALGLPRHWVSNCSDGSPIMPITLAGVWSLDTKWTWKKDWRGYPLVNVHITMERSTILNGKTHYKWSFSIATLNYQRVEAKNEDILWCLKIFEDIWWYCMHWKSPVIASQTWILVNSQGLKVWAFVSWSRLFLPGNNAWQLWRPKGGCAWKCLMKYPRFISSNLIVKLM